MSPRRAGPAKAVLWAEDTVQDQVLIRESLRGHAAIPKVDFANDGVHLLDALRGSRPDLVVLDLKMPRLGGLEALRRLRSDDAHRDLKVCVFSAGNQPDEIAACKALGAVAVVQKPLDFDRFSKAVLDIVALA